METLAENTQNQSERFDGPPVSPRTRIVTAARRHFLVHGFRTVTMDDLAAELGMSKKTLYAHFQGKEALLQAVLLDKFESADKDFGEITSQAANNVPKALEDLLACVQRHAEEVRPPFFRDIQRDAPEMFALVERRRHSIIQNHFSKILQEGRRAGLIRKDVPVKIIIEIILGAVHGMMNPPKLMELGLTPKTGFTAIMSVLLDGVLVKKGRSKA